MVDKVEKPSHISVKDFLSLKGGGFKKVYSPYKFDTKDTMEIPEWESYAKLGPEMRTVGEGKNSTILAIYNIRVNSEIEISEFRLTQNWLKALNFAVESGLNPVEPFRYVIMNPGMKVGYTFLQGENTF